MRTFRIMVYFFTLLFIQNALALRVLVRIEKDAGELHTYRLEDQGKLPTVFQNEHIRKQMQNLPHGTDALIEGSIEFRRSVSDGPSHFGPVFVINSVHPVSLKDLGNVQNTPMPLPSPALDSHPFYSPKGLTLPDEAVASMTLTASFLLMDSLSNAGTDPSGRRDLKNAVLISAGTMATLFFIYEQLSKNK